LDVIVLSSHHVLDYDSALEVLMAKSRTTAQGLDMRDLARAGAEARLAALRAEETALLAAFPDLRSRSLRRPAPTETTSASTRQASRGRRRRMSAAQRKAVGARMRAYWAARRAEKAAGPESGGAGQTTRAKGRKRARAK
jgi:hypothetical protein